MTKVELQGVSNVMVARGWITEPMADLLVISWAGRIFVYHDTETREIDGDVTVYRETDVASMVLEGW